MTESQYPNPSQCLVEERFKTRSRSTTTVDQLDLGIMIKLSLEERWVRVTQLHFIPNVATLVNLLQWISFTKSFNLVCINDDGFRGCSSEHEIPIIIVVSCFVERYRTGKRRDCKQSLQGFLQAFTNANTRERLINMINIHVE